MNSDKLSAGFISGIMEPHPLAGQPPWGGTAGAVYKEFFFRPIIRAQKLFDIVKETSKECQMAIDAFVLWHQLEGWEFAEAFLSSPDFDIDTHKAICQNLKLPKNGTKGVLVSRIVGYGRNSFNKKISEIIVQQLVIRNKIWFTIKTGTINITQLPKCGEPAELLFSSGQEQWYGPIKDPIDECVSWYIRPVFIPHFGRLRN